LLICYTDYRIENHKFDVQILGILSHILGIFRTFKNNDMLCTLTKDLPNLMLQSNLLFENTNIMKTEQHH
jgi:hypothetical protein